MEVTVRFHTLTSFNPVKEFSRNLDVPQNLLEPCVKEKDFSKSRNGPTLYLFTILTELRCSKLNLQLGCETQRNLTFMRNF
jgi:hypothetical protein